MKVRVKEVRQGFFGFYGGKRQYPGDVFPLKSEKEFSESWMEKVEEPKPKTEAKPKSKPKTEAKPKQEEGAS